MAMSQPPTYDQNFNKIPGRQVLPPIHEALLPVRHNYFSSPVRDALNSPTVCQIPNVLDAAVPDVSPSLYNPTTSYKTGCSDVKEYMPTPTSAGLNPTVNSHSATDSPSSYISGSVNVEYTNVQYTTAGCNTFSYTVSVTPTVPATLATSTVASILCPLTPSNPSAETQSTQKLSYEVSSSATKIANCHMEQTGPSQSPISANPLNDDVRTIPAVNANDARTEYYQLPTTPSSAVQGSFHSPSNSATAENTRSFLKPNMVVGFQQAPVVAASAANTSAEGFITTAPELVSQRTISNGSRPESTEKKSSRSRKEAGSSKDVDEEVARNVTKILCASLKHKNARHYSTTTTRNSLLANPCTSGNFSDCTPLDSTPIGVLLGRKHICNNCNKAFTSVRNLHRHRSACRSMLVTGTLESKFNTQPEMSPQQLSRIQDSIAKDALSSSPLFNPTCQVIAPSGTFVSLPSAVSVVRKQPEKILKTNDGMGPQCEDSFLDDAVAEMSRNNDFDLITGGSITPHLLDVNDGGLSLMPTREETEIAQPQLAESQVYASKDVSVHPTTEDVKKIPLRAEEIMRLFKCVYCSKTVSSSRSLKRHQNTCKFYQNHLKALMAEVDKPSSSTTPAGISVPPTPVTQPVLSTTTFAADENSSVGKITNFSMAPKISAPTRRMSIDSSNMCGDCNKVLCSASNLKRHRGTCRAANIRNDTLAVTNQLSHAHSVPTTPTVASAERTEEPEKNAENHLLSSTSQVALEVSVKNRRRFSSGGSVTNTVCKKNPGTVKPQQNQPLNSMTNGGLNLDMVASKPWVTVGEHLKAQHNQRMNQQRQLEEQKRAEMQTSIVETKAQPCSVMKCVPVNQTYIYSIQSSSTKQPNLILWSQSNSATQNPVITVMTTSADSNTASFPETPTVPSASINERAIQSTFPSVMQQEKNYSVNTSSGTLGTEQLGFSMTDCATVGEVINKKLGLSSGASGSATQFSQASVQNPAETVTVKSNEVHTLNSTITTAPLPSNRFPSSNIPPISATYQAKTMDYSTKNSCKMVMESLSEPTDFRYECPECLKTYSCRKNVKRHRMAVHKLSAEDVAKVEPVKVLVTCEVDYRRQKSSSITKAEYQPSENYVTDTALKNDETEGIKFAAPEITVTQSQLVDPNLNMPVTYSQQTVQILNHSIGPPISSPPVAMMGQCWQPNLPSIQQSQISVNTNHLSADDNMQLARIEEDLRRSAEFKLANIKEADSESDVKKSVAELAEADTTTLSEDCEDLNSHIPSHPGSVPCSGRIVPSPSSSNVNCVSYSVPDPNTVSYVTPSSSGGLASQLPPIRTSLPPVQHVVYQTNIVLSQPKPRVLHSVTTPSQNRSQPRSRSHSTLPKIKQPHICADCNRTLSSDYSLKRHRSTCVEVKANAAAKAAAEGGDDDEHMRQNADGNRQVSYSILTNTTPSQIGIGDMSSDGQVVRMSQHLSPLIEKAEVVMPQPYTNFDEDVDTGVMCQICDCWLSGRREFDRHCEQRHPIVVDADSTTVHSYDQSVTPPSAFLVCSPGSDIGSGSSSSCSPSAPRKRSRYSSPGDSSCSSGKPSKHPCLACGKYYSSEWNLERHRRESCPLKVKRVKVNEEKSPRLSKLETLELPPLRLSDTKWIPDCYILVGDSRIAVSKSVLASSSTYFASLFQFYEGKDEVPLPEMVDPNAFSEVMDVFIGRQTLDDRNIDITLLMAEKFQIKTLYERCETFVAEKLPSSSVMHAIRLADEYSMLDLKNALFSSISIDVFRGLSADRDYCLMEPELKAELLEKWGTFL